jgi:hypothetical protein
MAAPFIKPEVYRYRTARAVTQEVYPEAASQSYQKGAFVYINPASGKVTECSTTPGNITKVYAIDTIAASGTTDYDRRLEPITNDCEIRVNVYYTGNTTLAVTAQAMVGNSYALVRVTSGSTHYWMLDKSNTVNKHAMVTKIDPNTTVGTQYGYVFVKINSQWLQYEADNA